MHRWVLKAGFLAIAVGMIQYAVSIAPVDRTLFSLIMFASSIPTYVAFKATRRR